jgi:hypothetical protein
MIQQMNELSIGAKFRTLLTGKLGEVIDPGEELGIAVRFSDFTEKVLHPEIRVEFLGN